MHDWNTICNFAFLFSYSLLDCDGVSTIEGESLIQDSNSDVVSITYGPHKKLSRGDEMYNIREEFGMVKEKKVICSTELLLEVFRARCQTPGCTALPVVRYHTVSTTVVISSLCSSGHEYKFCSSHEVNGIYANNLQAAASLMLSGNNFAKMKRMADFFGLHFLSKSTYYRLQRLYLIPEIDDWWCWMRKELIKEFEGQDVVLGGDGQCDSPGFNAKNICYFLAEVGTGYIIDVEILDKRHVGLISTNMEKEAIRRGLEKVTKELKVVELVTDASTSIKALMGKYLLL